MYLYADVACVVTCSQIVLISNKVDATYYLTRVRRNLKKNGV